MDLEIPIPIVANSSGFFNASYKLATRFFGIPSRVLARMRRLDDILDQDYSSGLGEPTSTGNAFRSHRNIRSGTQQAGNGRGALNIPGPWGFLTSGYFIGLFVMAFLLNRVQNIVVPPRHPPVYQHHRTQTSDRIRPRGMYSFFLRSLFPVNLSSTFSRFVFRIPSIYLLGKALLLWMVVLLQTAERYPTWEYTWAQKLGQWAVGKSMDEICWYTFTSVCVTLFVGALTSGLEGLSSSAQTPFNLFAYSFILYLYTSPAMHVDKAPDEGPSRPDKQVVVTIILPLAQLMMTHCMEVKQKWARMRLIPTTIIGLLSLIHFHSVQWFCPSSYPLPNYIPNIVESFLVAVTLTTCSLNALTQLLLTGSITKPLFGHADSLMPKWDEDFTIVMFRLGTASLEATNVAGLGNEVGGVSATSTLLSRRDAHGADNQATIELHRSGVVSYSGPVLGRKSKRGFVNEITQVKAGGTQTDYWVDSVVDSAWRRELSGFGKALWRALRRTWTLVRGRPRPLPSPVAADQTHDNNTHTAHAVDHEEDDYARFLRGEDVSDDEEDEEEFSPWSRSSSPISPLDLSDAEGDEREEGDEDQGEHDGNNVSEREAVSLYADLSLTASDPASAPLLLAHMTSTSHSPLTRRRYTRLVSGGWSRRDGESGSEGDEWEEYVLENRETKAWKRNSEDDSSRKNCVVCTVEPRQIICWPCRCLALCDDCRENMASRSAASKHTCPCCRRSVEGYSKIYIP